MTRPAVDRSRPPAAKAQRPFELPPIELRRPVAGVELCAMPRSGMPLVSIELLWRRGAACEAATPRGLATLAAAMLDEGTTELSAMEIAEEIEALGGHLASTADWDGTYLATTVTSGQLADAVDLLGRVVANPSFPEHEVERLCKQRLAELRRRSARPDFLAARQILRSLYDGHVYGETLLGDASGVGSIDREAVVRWHARHLVTSRLFVLAAGDFEPEALERLLAAALEDREPEPGDAGPAPDAPSPERRVVIVDRPGAPQTELRIGHPGPPRAHLDRVPLTVLTTLFGGKFTSRINLRLREELGVTYGAHCRLSSRRGPGPFVVGAAVTTEAVGAAATEILAGMDLLRSEPATASEVADARSYLLGTFPYTIQAVDGLIHRMEQIALHDLGWDHYRRLPAEIQAVSPADLLRVAREHLRPEVATVVAVGPADSLRPQLEALGPVDLVAARSAAP